MIDLAKVENYAIPEAIRALEYLAHYQRPEGGSQFPNSECCWMIADELKAILRKYRGEALTDAVAVPREAGVPAAAF